MTFVAVNFRELMKSTRAVERYKYEECLLSDSDLL